MTFLASYRLWLLVVVALLAVGYVVLQFRRRSYAVRFTNTELLGSVAPKRPGWRRHVPATIFLVSLAVMVVAFAQPARDVEVPRERATVVLAIDTSLSMMADDVSPTRFEAAKEAAAEFIDQLPPRINLGLVSFDGTAVMRVPPSTDHQASLDALDELELDEATAIGDAILTSLAAIETVPPDAEGTPPPASIILMSDGENTVGTANEDAVEAAQEAEVPVSTIAFGTEFGVIELPEEPLPIPVVVDEEALADIADDTGGNAFTAESTDELRTVYEDIGSSVGYETEQREITIWFVGFAMALMLVTAGLSLAWFSRLP